MSTRGDALRYELGFLVKKIPHLDREGLRVASLRLAALAYRAAADVDYLEARNAGTPPTPPPPRG